MASSPSTSHRSATSRAYRKKLQWKSNVHQFKSFISSLEPNDRQMEMISRSPFAWALDIPFNANIRGLVQNMFDHWDYEAKCFIFQDQEIRFTKKDVALILGLPDHGDEVPMHLDMASSPFYVQHFRGRECSKSEVENMLINTRKQPSLESDILFCKLVVLYFFICVLFTTTSSISRLPIQSLIDCLDDFDNLGRYNWCKAVYEYMTPQMEPIGVMLSQRAKPATVEGNQTPMLKGFAHLLAVWMCEHVRIIEPHQNFALPRICRWKWTTSRVEKIKAMIGALPPSKIIATLLPSDLEEHLLSTDILAVIEQQIDDQIEQNFPNVSFAEHVPEDESDHAVEDVQEQVECEDCKLKEVQLADIRSVVAELKKDIEEKGKKCSELTDIINKSASDSDLTIAAKDNAIEEKDRIISVKDIIIAEQQKIISDLQSQLLGKDTAIIDRPLTRPATDIEAVPLPKRIKKVSFEDVPSAEVAAATPSTSKALHELVKQKSKIMKQAKSYFKKKKDAVVADTLLKLSQLK